MLAIASARTTSEQQGKEIAEKIEAWMKVLARAETGAMPAFGAKIVEMVLQDRAEGGLREVWEGDVRRMAGELKARRRRLRELLEGRGTPGVWSFLEEQKGMFS